MHRTIFATAAVVVAAVGLVTSHAVHASAITSAPAAAQAATCNGDGLALLCASTSAAQDALAINYQITQMDGPGTYSVYYTNTTTGVSSRAQIIGPLGYQNVATGVLYAAIQKCYNVTLVSTPGTSLTVGPVCG